MSPRDHVGASMLAVERVGVTPRRVSARNARDPFPAVLLILGTFPGVTAAEVRSVGTVVVAEGETVDEDPEPSAGR